MQRAFRTLIGQHDTESMNPVAIVCQLTDQNGKETEGQVRIPLLGARFTYEARFSGSAPSRHAALKVEL
jgi:hypothetical protein